jgi:hypothetical protein
MLANFTQTLLLLLVVGTVKVCHVCVNVYSGEDVQRYRNIILVDYRISDPVD